LIFVCPFVLFLFTVVLSVPLRFTDSNYPFGIFKLFLYDTGKSHESISHTRCATDMNRAYHIWVGGSRGRDRMVVGFTTTYVISAYYHYSCEFESHLWRGVLDTTLCDKVCQWLDTTLCDKACQWLETARWFSPVSSTNKTGRHDITEILLKVALNTRNQPTNLYESVISHWLYIYIYVKWYLYSYNILYTTALSEPWSMSITFLRLHS
jgi:hypothetical protein